MAAPAQYIPADDDDDDIDESALPSFGRPAPPTPRVTSPAVPVPKGKARAPDQLAPPSGANSGRNSPANGQLSGTIGSPVGGYGAGGPRTGTGARQKIGGVSVETRYTGVNTLDEPISKTIGRDLFSIYVKLFQVLYPRRTDGREVLRDWDLWGPLILCLALGIMLSANAPPDQSLGVFTGVVVIVSVGSLIVTLNAKLLGGKVSLFQSLCVLGYCIFPLVVASVVSTFVHVLYVRAPVALAAWAWCVWASVNFFDGTRIESQRVLLAVYPLCLFYFILAWMIVIE
jgi:hypothetical protein